MLLYGQAVRVESSCNMLNRLRQGSLTGSRHKPPPMSGLSRYNIFSELERQGNKHSLPSLVPRHLQSRTRTQPYHRIGMLVDIGARLAIGRAAQHDLSHRLRALKVDGHASPRSISPLPPFSLPQVGAFRLLRVVFALPPPGDAALVLLPSRGPLALLPLSPDPLPGLLDIQHPAPELCACPLLPQSAAEFSQSQDRCCALP